MGCNLAGPPLSECLPLIAVRPASLLLTNSFKFVTFTAFCSMVCIVTKGQVMPKLYMSQSIKFT